MTTFREIAPGVFVRDIDRRPTSRATVKRVSNMRFPAVNEVLPTSRATPARDSLGELFGTALHVANTIGDVRARVDHSLREARALFGEQLREAERAIERASRKVR